MNKAADINQIATFLGMRDLSTLTQEAVLAKIGQKQVDVCVLFGGSILAGGDTFARAIKNRIARCYIIVGGHGHTTQILKEKMAPLLPNVNLDNLSEAEIFQTYLKQKYNLKPDFLEKKSTNCGNNITYLLAFLEKEKIPYDNILLMQDATMMRRMVATMKKYAPNKNILAYATYKAEVTKQGKKLVFVKKIPGMWTMKQYLQLLMGEIPRLQDDANGYGPHGKNYLAHVAIPTAIEESFTHLTKDYPNLIRKANPAFKS